MKIKIDPEKRVNLYNAEFDVMRNDLNIAIQSTLAKMIAKRINTGAIGLKIDIAVAKTPIKDDNAPTGTREALLSAITYKVATVLTQKDEAKGKIVGPADDKEILVDDDGDFFLVSKQEASGQLSMFNNWDEFAAEVTGAKGEDD